MPHIEVVRAEVWSDDLLELLHEYYEAVNVVVRDSGEALAKYLMPDSGVWMASVDGQPVGCVCLRPLPAIENASECKRLYVRPAGRGMGIANRLMDALESYAGTVGYQAVYLDTYDDLKPAIALYAGRGYKPCERYNNNPQATVFMRKQLLALSD